VAFREDAVFAATAYFRIQGEIDGVGDVGLRRKERTIYEQTYWMTQKFAFVLI
jgi:hypothetical protein